jgi:hypothetical protein
MLDYRMPNKCANKFPNEMDIPSEVQRTADLTDEICESRGGEIEPVDVAVLGSNINWYPEFRQVNIACGSVWV